MEGKKIKVASPNNIATLNKVFLGSGIFERRERIDKTHINRVAASNTELNADQNEKSEVKSK